MRGKGTLVGAPGEVQRRERNTNAETARTLSWHREMEQLPGECRAYSASEIFVGVFPALAWWAKLFRTYGTGCEMSVHGRSSMEWGTRSVGRSRGINSVWTAGWPDRMERSCSAEWRARNFWSGSL